MSGKWKLFLSILALMGTACFLPSNSFSSQGEALVIELEGPISSGAATFLTRGIRDAGDRGSGIVIIRLDTPGGLGASMKTMAKAILNSPVPVVVYVAPRGAGAASAGVLITIAAHIAAMAPGTNIGAAHPVMADGSDIKKTMEDKIVNDMAAYGRGIAEDRGRNSEWVEKAIRESVSITAEEAFEKKVIDVIAEDMDDLLKKIDGREVAIKSGKINLETRDMVKIFFKPRVIDKVLMFISDPTIMALLFSIGLLGLGFEITHPGAIFPGVIGAMSLILALYSMQTLPVNYAGLMLIVLAIVLFLLEIKVTSFGILSLGGIISLTLGSMMFFEDLGLRFTKIIPFIVIISGFFILIGWLAASAQLSRPKGGISGLIGQTGVVKKTIDREGLIFVNGEYWTAVSDSVIPRGAEVRVLDANGLTLTVEKV